uniref:ATPase dynein-related AAA domain-containing protein n=1 Tax=Megaselia scalaris TaxID=36166 RepID=T1GG08_MEGSC
MANKPGRSHLNNETAKEPTIELPKSSNALYYMLFNECVKLAYDFFVEKLQQLYEMIVVRHGLMLVGLPFGGKTTCYRILAEVLLYKRCSHFETLAIYTIINPKAFTLGPLYGQCDQVSHEWNDGILAVSYRHFAVSTTDERKWLIFDGPVDAIWIENMKTVLDYNKKCREKLFSSNQWIWKYLLLQRTHQSYKHAEGFYIPDTKTGTVFDYKYIKEGKGKWKPCEDEAAAAPPTPRDILKNQIIVTTHESTRVTAIFDLLLRHSKPVMFVGPTDTGKSCYVMDYLLKKIDTEIYKPLFMNFSAQTSANQTQDIIMSKLDKRRKGVYGPPLGKKCVIFVDDISMLLKETYGARPPIEILRMLFDHWMWYDRKNTVPLKLIDIQLHCVMGPPSTGNM